MQGLGHDLVKPIFGTTLNTKEKAIVLVSKWIGNVISSREVGTQKGAFANLSMEGRLSYRYPPFHCGKSIRVDFITGGDHPGDGIGEFCQVAKINLDIPA